MQLILYKTDSEDIRLNKTLNDETPLNGVLLEKQDISSLAIRLTTDGNDLDMFGYNYAYIPEFKRFYFVRSIDVERNTLFIFHLNVDVLMSFKEDINAMLVLLDKDSDTNDGNMDAPMTGQKYLTGFQEIENPFKNQQLYMTTIKGV